MIINGFGGGSGGFEGASTLVKTYSSSYSITRNGSEIALNNGGEISCSTTSLTKMWHSTNASVITTWDNFRNNINAKAIKLVFKINSISATGKICFFTTKNGTTAAQTVYIQIEICPIIYLRYVNGPSWGYESTNPFSNITMGSDSSGYGSHKASMTKSYPSMSSSAQYTYYDYPSFTLNNPLYWESSYFIQELGTEGGEKYWRPFAPSSDMLKYGVWGYGDISVYFQCNARCASGGNGNMSYRFYDSGNSNCWPIMTINYSMEIYAIN